MDTAIVGLIISRDVLLEAQQPLELGAGLNVVYGLNGAGKSRLLAAIENALLGADGATNVALVIRIHRDGEEEVTTEEGALAQIRAYGRTPAQAIAAALATPRDFPLEDREFAAPLDQRSPRPGAVRELLDEWVRARAGEGTPVASEISKDSLFLLAPTGTRSVPSWNVWPVADMRKPEASAALRELDEFHERYANMLGDNPDMLDAHGDLEDAASNSPLFASEWNEIWSLGLNRHLLEPTPLMAYQVGEHSADQVEPVRVSGKIDFGLELVDTSREANDATRAHFGVLHSYLSSAAGGEDKAALSLRTFREGGIRLLDPDVRERLVADAEPEVDWSHELKRLFPAHEEEHDSGVDITAVEAVMKEVTSELEVRVNAILQSVLLDAPAASLHIESPFLRFVREPLVWKFGRRSLRLRDLSRAEQLWASRAIHEAIHAQMRDLALGESGSRTTMLIVDEPEAALHRGAEAHMAATLRRRACDDVILVAATHSPELLDAPEGRVIEVKRGGGSHGRSLIHELDQSDRTTLAELGLMPSDLLRWPRVILLVEGEHDDVLLDHFLGDRLRAARVRVLPLHGGSKLPGTVDSQVLFEHTDAHVVAVLDNMRAARLREVWERAVDLAARGEPMKAKAAVLDGLPDDKKRKGDEAGYMRSWLTKAIDAGLASRATPYGLEEVDIIRYLSVAEIVPDAESWDELDKQHQDELAAARPDRRPPTDFKKWLAVRRKVDINPAVLRRAADRTSLPRDFARLMKMLEALSGEVR
ncbi:hypothetical protein [Microbacterium sp. zg.Y909]|uniref:hypothetical protein n=1 Tax=Microbacterium sp. zg.Y909 TaxID=2969413 RepID=UPI00214BE8D5|nr:hypothetical protein [Microbacterium sp. zg.Y909]MCR2824313.1 hypothetical protein [Microbacterium sp. zg.Y909]